MLMGIIMKFMLINRDLNNNGEIDGNFSSANSHSYEK